ncbi:unnamed protein product [Chilo suppressalis]|uniref:DUF4371 domain-containing protein n=1 Tax=Chilo suppressalis TaxID=168631 RepID=A0ABN8B669_CHISP|nr:unnamed protein product [Chilo suppressalis]
MNHLNNIYHQYQAINSVKRQVDDETAMLHIDFAENYVSKYAEEVQAVHFGASKPQISLHTAVLYHFGELDSTITPFCTVSKNLRHDPVFICNNLKPIIKIIKDLHPNLKTMHFVSDGPSSQYRNKSMFFLMANFLAVKLNVQSLVWDYNEAGHGKDSPDGIGAIVKRIADQSVARGNDIANFEQLITCLYENCRGVQILSVDEENITEIEELMARSLTPTFKGTLNVHQITRSKNNPGLLRAQKLSCMDCRPHQICPHYEIGVISTETVHNRFESSIPSPPRNTKEVLPSSPPHSECTVTDYDSCHSSPERRSPAIYSFTVQQRVTLESQSESAVSLILLPSVPTEKCLYYKCRW